MPSALLLCMAFLSLDSPATTDLPAAAQPVRAAYESAKAKAGRDPDAQVRLALWCEAQGLKAERLKHLALAVLTNPAHVTARGLLGLVPYRGQWKTPEAIKASVDKDEALNAAMAEYARRRGHMANTADAHWKMAVWCEETGLRPEAHAHLAIVLQLDPSREAAWKRLDYKKVRNRWVTDAQIAAERAEAESQKAADKHYMPLLARWRSSLSDRGEARRAQASQELSNLTDPRAVPSVWTSFANGNVSVQKIGVQVLGQIDSPGSTRALAILAVFSESPEVRGQATETLQRRDLRDFVGFLIGLLRDQVQYQVKPVGGPGSSGVLFVNGKQFNVQRLYDPPALPNIPLFPGEQISYDANGLPVVSRFLGPGSAQGQGNRSATVSLSQYSGHAPVDPAIGQLIAQARNNPANAGIIRAGPNLPIDFQTRVLLMATSTTPVESNLKIPIGQIMLEYQTAALASQEQLAGDIRTVEAYNADLRMSNQRVLQVLTATTGIPLGEKQEDWKAWWTDYQGYSYTRPPETPKPTIVEEVEPAYIPQPDPVTTQIIQTGPTAVNVTAAVQGHSCFQAGTLVSTLAGYRPVEAIQAGDQVLTQDPESGKLAFQPLVAVYHNKPSQLLEIRIGDEVIGATPIHRFWKVGKGWTMARDLKEGDPIRAVGGISRVKSIERGPIQPVYNLKVAESASFFVGQHKFLVHDNSLVQPALKPFDAIPEQVINAPVTP
jgi:Pretoxin HINT domain